MIDFGLVCLIPVEFCVLWPFLRILKSCRALGINLSLFAHFWLILRNLWLNRTRFEYRAQLPQKLATLREHATERPHVPFSDPRASELGYAPSAVRPKQLRVLQRVRPRLVYHRHWSGNGGSGYSAILTQNARIFQTFSNLKQSPATDRIRGPNKSKSKSLKATPPRGLFAAAAL